MEKDGITVIDILSSSDEEEDDGRSPLSTISVNSAMKDEHKKTTKKNKDDDCIILDFNPFESMNKLSIEDVDQDAQDLVVIAETGQVACRDYPHSRHLCVKFPFNKTPHSRYCQQCYCYVCDSSAPCKVWYGISGHCNATENDEKWKNLRESRRAVPATVKTG